MSTRKLPEKQDGGDQLAAKVLPGDLRKLQRRIATTGGCRRGRKKLSIKPPKDASPRASGSAV